MNQESVELFLNGQSLGSQPVKKNSHLMWKVKYVPGALEARATKGGSVVLTDKRETAGPAAKIVAIADRAQSPRMGRTWPSTCRSWMVRDGRCQRQTTK